MAYLTIPSFGLPGTTVFLVCSCSWGLQNWCIVLVSNLLHRQIRRLAYIRACTSPIAKGHDRVPAGPAGAVRKHRKTQPGELFIWEGFLAAVEKQDDKKYPPPHLLCVSVQ